MYWYPNEIRGQKVSLSTSPVTIFKNSTGELRFSLQTQSTSAKVDFKLERVILYADHMIEEIIRSPNSYNFVGSHLEQVLDKRNEAFLLSPVGKELDFYVNLSDMSREPEFPNRVNHAFKSERIYGPTGTYWGSYLDLPNVKYPQRSIFAVDGGVPGQRYLLSPFANKRYAIGLGGSQLFKLTPKSTDFHLRITGFGPFQMRFQIEFQKKMRVLMYQTRNGEPKRLIGNSTTHFDFNLEGFQRNDVFVWSFECPNDETLVRMNAWGFDGSMP